MARSRGTAKPAAGEGESLTANSPTEPQEPVPWLWLGLGGVVTVLALAALLAAAARFLSQAPVAARPEPTIIILTAPADLEPLATEPLLTPTTVPTPTPIPTPAAAIVLEELAPGFYARVANTGGAGVTVRGGPSTANQPLAVAPDDTVLLLLDGPAEGGGYLWWQVQLEDGSQGWVAGDFLTPAAAP